MAEKAKKAAKKAVRRRASPPAANEGGIAALAADANRKVEAIKSANNSEPEAEVSNDQERASERADLQPSDDRNEEPVTRIELVNPSEETRQAPPPDEETAGNNPRTNPRKLARTTTSKNSALPRGSAARKQRIRKRAKAPRQKKDQLNGRVPEFIIDSIRDWCDEQGITEIGEGMTILLESKMNDESPATIAGAYADWCVENGYYTNRRDAYQRYLNGDD